LPSGFAWLDASSWFRAPTAGNGHETAADGVVPDNRQRFPVQLGELLAQLPPGAQCSDEALRKRVSAMASAGVNALKVPTADHS
jgi:hypothetical protein